MLNSELDLGLNWSNYYTLHDPCIETRVTKGDVTINRFSVRGRGATVEARVFRFFFHLLVNGPDGSSMQIKLV